MLVGESPGCLPRLLSRLRVALPLMVAGSASQTDQHHTHQARGATHHQALRALGNRLVGILHGCLARRLTYQEQVAWPAA